MAFMLWSAPPFPKVIIIMVLEKMLGYISMLLFFLISFVPCLNKSLLLYEFNANFHMTNIFCLNVGEK